MGLLVVKPWLGFVVFITIDVNLITNIQRSRKWLVRGLVKFVPAVA